MAGAEQVFRRGHQDEWRSLAGLLLATLQLGRGDTQAAHRSYRTLAEATWARRVRPQALLGSARTAPTAAGQRRWYEQLAKSAPDTDEGDAARVFLKKPPRSRGRFGVQVGAFKLVSTAREEVARWKKQGKPALLVRKSSPFGPLQCVIVGPFTTRALAEHEREALKASGVDSMLTAL